MTAPQPHYGVRVFFVLDPKVELSYMTPGATPVEAPPLKRYRMVQFMEMGHALDLCDHEHVSRKDALKCPVDLEVKP